MMDEPVRGTENSRDALRGGGVELMSRAELAHCRHWRNAFVGGRKDHRFYELVEDTIRQGFDYRYFAIKGRDGEVQAIQPFFILDQDLFGGVTSKMRAIVHLARRVWPRFLTMRTLMVGCCRPGRLDGANYPQVKCSAPRLRHCDMHGI
jgi:hypothetical protein